MKEDLIKIQNTLFEFIKKQNAINNEIFKIIGYSKGGILNNNNNISEQQTSIDANTSDISDNRQGLTETFEATLTNTDDVAINRQAIEELFEMITAESEVK